MGGLERQSNPTPTRACELEHPLPAVRLRVERRVPGRHVARRIACECPLLPGVAVGAVARADAARIGVRQRAQTAGLDGLADVRVIDHDQVVAVRELGQRLVAEALQRAVLPCHARRGIGRRAGFHRQATARVVPAQRTQ